MRRTAMLALVLLVAGVVNAAPVRWYEAYRKGVAAAQGRDWSTAVEQMELAIAQRPTEALAAPAARNQTIEYVPHFWLGVARFNLGDIEAATREWDISQSQGVIQRTQNYSVLQSYRAQARSLLDKKTTERSADTRRNADMALKKALGSRMQAMTAGADRLESYRAAGRRLQEAWDKFNGAGSDVAAYREASKLAGEADAMFTASANEARARKSARAAAPPPVRAPQPQPAPTTTHGPAEQPAPAPSQAAATPSQEQPSVAKIEVIAPDTPRRSTQWIVTRDALERLKGRLNAAQARKASDPGFVQFVASAGRNVEGWTRELTPELGDDDAAELEREIRALDRRLADEVKSLAKTIPPAELEKGLVRAQLLNAYASFAGSRLTDAEAQLTALIRSHPDLAEAFLLRGCARYTQSVLTGDASATRAAENDFAAALRLRPGIGLDSRHFSPKLIAALRDVKAKQRK